MIKPFLLASIASLAFAAGAWGDDLSFTLSPTVETYPPSYNLATCEAMNPFGQAQPCLDFFGTLTDTDVGDTDNLNAPLLSLDSLTVDFGSPAIDAYFTVDNTFYGDPPGLMTGDTHYALDGNYPNTYAGAIFGLDFNSNIPDGVYNGVATILFSGGDSGANDNIPETAQFTVVIVPEPAGVLLVAAGLAGLLALPRGRSASRCCSITDRR